MAKRFRVFAVIAAAALMLLAAVNVLADDKYVDTNGNSAVILDEIDLITDEQETLLLERMKPLLQYGNAVFVSSNTANSDTHELARQTYRGLFERNSGMLFMVDMYNRYLWIYSEGAMEEMITSNKSEEITDNVYSYASDGDYYECARRVYDQCAGVMAGEKIITPMRYVTNAVLAVGLALLINIWIVVWQRRKPNPQYIIDTVDGARRGTVTGVNIRMTNSTRTRRQSSGGGGFIGGGGGSGGGGSSGGSGGGHRF